MLGVLIAVMYIGSHYIDKIFLSGDKVSRKLSEEMSKLKKIRIKSMEDQNKYLDMMDDKKKMYGDPFKKFMFYILTLISYSILIGFVPNKTLLVLTIPIYSILVPLGYRWKDRANIYKDYNFWTMFIMFIFFTSYVVIQSTDPLMFMGFKMHILFLLPFMLIINFIIGWIKKKIQRRNFR